jgi:hypothetical protein
MQQILHNAFKHILPFKWVGFKTQKIIIITLAHISLKKAQGMKGGLYLAYTRVVIAINDRVVVRSMVGGVAVVVGVVVVVVSVVQQ